MSSNAFLKHLKILTGVALSSILLTSFAKKVRDVYVESDDVENDGLEEVNDDTEVTTIKDNINFSSNTSNDFIIFETFNLAIRSTFNS